MRKILILLAFILLSQVIFAQSEVVVRIDQPSTNELAFIKTNKLEITAFQENNFVDIMVDSYWINQLDKKKINYHITQSHQQNIINLGRDKAIPGYQSYDEVIEELQQIALDYPEICSLYDIGDSKGKIYFNDGLENYEDYQHEIWMMKISDNVSESEDEPAVYYFGAHHAREPISTQVVLGVINHLIEGYGNDDEITNMVNEAEIYLVPMVNPDGHEVVLDQLNTNWRKNISDNDENGILNFNSGSQDGVDPNRNYAWEWGGDGSSGDQTAETYRGPSEFSEPETQAIRDLLAAHHFTSGISYHSYSELVLWPYAYSASAVAPDHEALEELGTEMAATIPKIIGSGYYTPDQANDLYPAAGVTGDYCYGEHGIFHILIELAQEFIPPAPQVPAIVNDNIEAAMIVLNRANKQVVRGHVYDALTLEPLVATVEVDGIDGTQNFRKPYKSNAEYGSYYRLLTSGTKTVTFSAYGYISQTFDDVEVLDEEATILDVYLEQALKGPVFGSVIDGSTGNNIEGAEISILNTPLLPVYTDESGVYEMEEVAFSTYEIKVSKEGYSTIIMEQEITEDHFILNFVLLPSEAIGFDDGEFPDDFNFGGNVPWELDENESYNGGFSAVSGDIGDSQSSTMILEVEDAQAGEFSFYRKVSSEANWDFLRFYIDGSERESWSGEEDWAKATFTISEGNHEFKWTYDKDSNTTHGSDQGWVDEIELPAAAITMVNAGPDMEICHDAQATLNAFAANYETISWTSSGDGTFSNGNNPNTIYTPGAEDIANGSVSLEITANGNSGSATDEMTLFVETCLNIAELEANDFRISPNPAQEMVNIEFDGKDLKELRIFHISGQMIQHIQLTSQQENIRLNTKVFGSGVYIVKVINKQGWSIAKRLVVE